MIKNYLKIAFRNISRNKGFSFINISGLVIGMASAILILLWIQNELSYDRFHTNTARLYEIFGNNLVQGQVRTGMATPEIMAPVLKNDVPEVEKVSRISWGENYLLTIGDKSLKAKSNLVDQEFLSMFDFPLIKGNKKTVLSDPYAIVLTQQLAKKIFGNEDPIGKIIKVENDENYKVTGILKDLPNNTQFDFEYLLSYDHKTQKKYIDSDWTDVSIRTYVLLKPNTSFDAANAKIKNVIIAHSGGRAKTEQFLYPFSKLRLYASFENGKSIGGMIERVRTFAIIAVFILLIACINFMNLSTARSEKRAKEVGIRKVAGALKKSLVAQFLAESIFTALIAGLFAVALVQLCLPVFNQLVQKQLFINYSNIYFWLTGAGFILFTGILAGSYPAFFLSAFKPVLVLKGTFKKINALVTPRKILVVLQFTFAIALIICTIIVKQQIQFAQERETGYNKKNLGYVFIQGDIYKNYAIIKNELLNAGVATSISKTQAPLTQNWSSGISMKWQGKDADTKIQINRYTEDGDLVKTAGMQLVEGRDIDVKNFPTDSTGCLISEAAVKAMGFKDPIGQVIFDDPINWHVVGVIKDFILESPYETIKPFMIKGPRYRGNVIHIKLNNANTTAKNLAGAALIFKKYNPAYPFDFHFTDEEYAKKFSDEELTGKLASLFAALTIFISCLGLFGLAAYMAENRVKEIGVRKILGASVTSIAALLSKDFVKLVVIAIVIASPVAWWVTDKWLQEYNYRINISWWVFGLAGAAAIFIALITVSFQAIKAAIANPVKSLRTE
ncbi:MAG TPA: ABC transporter permease [Chitinophagaceae bacterium]|nr:ABC transporter permease [Chitinophagaceae bacterium]